MPLPRMEDDVRITGVDVERERPAQEHEPILLRAVEDGVRVARRLMDVPRQRNEHGERERDRSGREGRPPQRPVEDRDRCEHDDRDPDHPDRPSSDELARSRAAGRGRGRLPRVRPVRSISASTSSAPAVTSIPRAPGGTSRRSSATTGKNAKKSDRREPRHRTRGPESPGEEEHEDSGRPPTRARRRAGQMVRVVHVERPAEAAHDAGDRHKPRRGVVGAHAVRRQHAVVGDAARIRDVLLRAYPPIEGYVNALWTATTARTARIAADATVAVRAVSGATAEFRTEASRARTAPSLTGAPATPDRVPMRLVASS